MKGDKNLFFPGPLNFANQEAYCMIQTKIFYIVYKNIKLNFSEKFNMYLRILDILSVNICSVLRTKNIFHKYLVLSIEKNQKHFIFFIINYQIFHILDIIFSFEF